MSASASSISVSEVKVEGRHTAVALTALIVGSYVIISICILIFAHWASIPSIITVVVGAVVIAIPALDLAQSLAAVRILRTRLALLNSEELEEFRRIVMRRELDSRLEDPSSRSAKAPSPTYDSPLAEPVDQLENLLVSIANDESLRTLVSPPLMQESRLARMRYLKRVWPEGGPGLKAIG